MVIYYLANWRWMIWTRPGLAHRRLRGAEAEAAGASSPLHNPYGASRTPTNSPALRLPTPCAPPRALGDELLPRPSGRGAALRLPPAAASHLPPRALGDELLPRPSGRGAALRLPAAAASHLPPTPPTRNSPSAACGVEVAVSAHGPGLGGWRSTGGRKKGKSGWSGTNWLEREPKKCPLTVMLIRWRRS
uniref:Uncharacterized protein n=2 Tax=Aegilops tauschii subsp. strangulata TaxID=200361 RepID=A0A452YYQ5_AEGTS